MDLTIPYTFYPTALPHWMAWTLFLIATAGGVGVGMVRARGQRLLSSVLVGVVSGAGLLIVTMIASMVITFFVHDV